MLYPAYPSLIVSLLSKSVESTNHEALIKSKGKTATWKIQAETEGYYLE
jgi:hypothetical protein